MWCHSTVRCTERVKVAHVRVWKIQELSEPSEARQEAQWPEGLVPQKCYDSRICVMQQGEGSEAGL